ncbi:MAG: hypothetical protein GF344_14410 [Chitinivibrionales bacterium]|nr:hypothetical protein [Chitinivibrionales bacterium]MBD3357917.1 hypothetical protein [Chitinivibrionales bacterium]
MQKLSHCALSMLRPKKGSALVGVIVLSTIMAIVGVGLLRVASSAVNNEVAALEECQAFWAAESGLHLAAKRCASGSPPNAGDTVLGPISIGTMSVIALVLPDAHSNAFPITLRTYAFVDPSLSAAAFRKALKATVLKEAGGDINIKNWIEEEAY